MSLGAEINIQDDIGHSVLMLACASDSSAGVIKLLLKNNADVNLHMKDGGYTALMFACTDNEVETVQLLLECGAHSHSKPRIAYDLTTNTYIKSLIKSWLPQNSYKICDVKQCFICSEVDCKKYIQLHCNHVFHYICIDMWLFEQRTCPECRAMIY